MDLCLVTEFELSYVLFADYLQKTWSVMEIDQQFEKKKLIRFTSKQYEVDYVNFFFVIWQIIC